MGRSFGSLNSLGLTAVLRDSLWTGSVPDHHILWVNHRPSIVGACLPRSHPLSSVVNQSFASRHSFFSTLPSQNFGALRHLAVTSRFPFRSPSSHSVVTPSRYLQHNTRSSNSVAMSDDEADPELVALLRKTLGLGGSPDPHTAETKVLQNAQYIFDNAIDVALNSAKTKEAAETIWQMMQKKEYSTQIWAEHELHPKTKDERTVDFIFTMDLLNFSFWSELPSDKRFAIEYRGKKWTGYWSLVAALQRALDEDIPITTPEFWANEEECTEEVIEHVFRSATEEDIPLLEERLQCLREAGRVLCREFEGSFLNCIYSANYSAAALVNLVTESFACFRDETTFNGRRVRIYKRAQILVADLWACFNGEGFGEFHDIDTITMFADYRIPQMLHQLGCLMYSPPLEAHIRDLKLIPSGSNWETELRGASIWCVELIKREIERRHPEVKTKPIQQAEPKPPSSADNSKKSTKPEEHNGKQPQQGYFTVTAPNDDAVQGKSARGINAILIDFFLYDTMKELEKEGQESIPHHRTRSIWY